MLHTSAFPWDTYISRRIRYYRSLGALYHVMHDRANTLRRSQPSLWAWVTAILMMIGGLISIFVPVLGQSGSQTPTPITMILISWQQLTDFSRFLQTLSYQIVLIFLHHSAHHESHNDICGCHILGGNDFYWLLGSNTSKTWGRKLGDQHACACVTRWIAIWERWFTPGIL